MTDFPNQQQPQPGHQAPNPQQPYQGQHQASPAQPSYPDQQQYQGQQQAPQGQQAPYPQQGHQGQPQYQGQQSYQGQQNYGTAQQNTSTYDTRPAQPGTKERDGLGLIAIIVGLGALVLNLLVTVVMMMSLRTGEITGIAQNYALTGLLGTIITGLGGIAALVLGLIGLRAPGRRVLSGIGTGIGLTILVSLVLTMVQTLMTPLMFGY